MAVKTGAREVTRGMNRLRVLTGLCGITCYSGDGSEGEAIECGAGTPYQGA